MRLVSLTQHDPTFARTTNIAKVFPSRARTRADLFTWMDIEQLNTGEWWLKVSQTLDPILPPWLVPHIDGAS